MLRTMEEPLGEVRSVTRRLRQRGLGLQTSRRVNVFFLAKGQILFEQASYVPYSCSEEYLHLCNKPTMHSEKTYFISVYLVVCYISVNIPPCMDIEHIKP